MSHYTNRDSSAGQPYRMPPHIGPYDLIPLSAAQLYEYGYRGYPGTMHPRADTPVPSFGYVDQTITVGNEPGELVRRGVTAILGQADGRYVRPLGNGMDAILALGLLIQWQYATGKIGSADGSRTAVEADKIGECVPDPSDIGYYLGTRTPPTKRAFSLSSHNLVAQALPSRGGAHGDSPVVLFHHSLSGDMPVPYGNTSRHSLYGDPQTVSWEDMLVLNRGSYTFTYATADEVDAEGLASDCYVVADQLQARVSSWLRANSRRFVPDGLSGSPAAFLGAWQQPRGFCFGVPKFALKSVIDNMVNQ